MAECVDVASVVWSVDVDGDVGVGAVWGRCVWGSMTRVR